MLKWFFCCKMTKDQPFKHRKNINPFATRVYQIDIFVKLYLDFANDWGKNGKNGGYHVIEHLLMNKSRGGSFFKIFLFFWDSIRDMLLRADNSVFNTYQKHDSVFKYLRINENISKDYHLNSRVNLGC